MRRTAVATLAALVLGACGSGGVNWNDPMYGDNLQRFIDHDAAANDCSALQQMFDFWADNRPGDRDHPELLGYIADKLVEAGC